MVDTWFARNIGVWGKEMFALKKGGKRMYDYACVNKWTM
jgi:hypothetical protein